MPINMTTTYPVSIFTETFSNFLSWPQILDAHASLLQDGFMSYLQRKKKKLDKNTLPLCLTNYKTTYIWMQTVVFLSGTVEGLAPLFKVSYFFLNWVPHLTLWMLTIHHTPCFCWLVAKLCLILCNPMDCSMPGIPVLHYILEFAQTHIHWVSDAI